jgi:hypothetical protein
MTPFPEALPELEKKQGISYPAWPTSKPGPMITPSPFGEHPHALRSEQMIYNERYNQEQGRAGVSPSGLTVRKGNTKRYQPDNVPLDVAVPMD